MPDEHDNLIAELDAEARDIELKVLNYGARVGETIAGRLVRGIGGRFSSSGAAPSPSAPKPPATTPKPARGGGRRKKGAAPPKLTPEERRSQKEQERRATRDQILTEQGLDENLRGALVDAADGNLLTAANGARLGEMGLAEQATDGTWRLTPQGRAAVRAAETGNAGRVRDALSLGRDRAAAAAEKAKAAAEKKKGGGGGGKGKKEEPAKPAKPTPEETQAANRASVAAAMAEQNAGLAGPALEALMTFADGGNVATPDLLSAIAKETGLLEQDRTGGYRLSTQGRRFVRAVNKADVRGALDALSEARDRRAAQQENDMANQEKDGAMSEAKSASLDKRTEVIRRAVSTQLNVSAMIAFLLDDDTRQALIDAGELDEDEAIADHITLVYLTPEASDLDGQKNRLIAMLADLASVTPPVTGVVNGYGRFVGGEEGDALYVNADSPALPELRQRLTSCCRECGIAYANNHGFTPHITLSYLASDDETPDLDIPKLPLTFDRIAIVWAGETLTFPLLGAQPEPTPLSQALGYELELDDTIIAMGTPVKSLPDGRIGGYLVSFSDATHPDLAGDFFTADTDFGIPKTGAKTALYFNHRLPIKGPGGQTFVVKERIGDGMLSIDQHGVFIEAVLHNRKQYERMLSQLGWSSGTASHLVDREPVGKAFWVKSWPLGLDASLTPTPCSPDIRNHAIPLKSYIPSELTAETGPQVAGDAAASSGGWHGGAPAIKTHTTKEIAVDKDELKAMLEEMLKAQAGGIEAKMTELSTAVDTRLKAFEDSPALKNSGFISMDGGSADKEVKSFADWLVAVKRGDRKRLTTVYKSAWTDFGDGMAVKDLNEASGSGGGYLVPVEYEPELQRLSVEAAIVEPRARRISMGSATKQVPMLKQTANPSTADGGSAFFGGLVFYWNPEGSDISSDKSEPVWDMVELIARKLTGLTVASNELIEDAASVTSELLQLFAEGLAHAKDFFYLRGNGVGKPLGVLNAPCKYAVTRKASGNNVEIEDVSAMMARMLPGSFKNAIWVAHPLNISDLIQMKIGDTPVFQPDARGPVAGTLLGRPIAFSEYSPAPGSAGDLLLADFQAYAVGQRRGIAIASSEHARFDKDQTTWKITYRGDGQPLLDSTVKLADGSNTEVSPFVVLS